MDRFSAEVRSRIMRAIKSRDTAPERAFAAAIGIPYSRGGRRDCHADFTFPQSKVAVFVDGEFWHGRHFLRDSPRYSERWRRKIAGNMDRDLRSDSALESRGWAVVRLWESQVLETPEEVCRAVRALVESRHGIEPDLFTEAG